MGINDIQLTPELIALLYPESLVVMEEALLALRVECAPDDRLDCLDLLVAGDDLDLIVDALNAFVVRLWLCGLACRCVSRRCGQVRACVEHVRHSRVHVRLIFR